MTLDRCNFSEKVINTVRKLGTSVNHCKYKLNKSYLRNISYMMTCP
jgi:hypothetical protein